MGAVHRHGRFTAFTSVGYLCGRANDPHLAKQTELQQKRSALGARLKEVKIERRGIWASTKKPREKYPPLGTVTGDTNAASDHAAVWAEFDVP
jgi:hypothetical protein